MHIRPKFGYPSLIGYGMDKLVDDAQTHGHTDRKANAGNGNTQWPKLASDI